MKHVSALNTSREMQDVDVETYVIVIREVEYDDGVGMPIPINIFNVLAKYADLRPDEMPKLLPLIHIVDHNIELESGKQPRAKYPYHLL